MTASYVFEIHSPRWHWQGILCSHYPSKDKFLHFSIKSQIPNKQNQGYSLLDWILLGRRGGSSVFLFFFFCLLFGWTDPERTQSQNTALCFPVKRTVSISCEPSSPNKCSATSHSKIWNLITVILSCERQIEGQETEWKWELQPITAPRNRLELHF